MAPREIARGVRWLYTKGFREEEKMTGLSRAKMIIAIVVGAIGVIIVLQNFQLVETKVLLWRLTLPHVVFLGIVFGAGCILGAVLSAMLSYRKVK
jgi:uncharacterized integral membrane protein